VGDVVTHATISAHVVEQLKRVFGKRIPDAEYSYIELGNFLTDVKQFRDPPAFHKGRTLARAAAVAAARTERGALGELGVKADEWANAMFGLKDPGPRHGLLPEFLALLAQGFTHQVFDTDGLAVQAKKMPPVGGPTLVPAYPIDPFEVERVIRDQFDQYWPHDHVDFPPIKGDPTRHRRLPLFQPMSRGLIGFLERYIEFLSEELTKLEFDWASANTTALSASQAELKRRDFLVRLGVLLHAVEDFFFHSNFAELRQWQVLRRHFRDVDPVTPDGRAAIFGKGLWGTRLTGTVRLHRILYRRLRYPTFAGEDALARDASEDATELLYTGGFYVKDVYHTLGGALEAVERNAALLAQTKRPAASKLVLVRLAFSEEARRALVQGGDDAAKSQRATHADQLKNGEYTAAIDRQREAGSLSIQAAERLREAFELDQRAAQDHDPLPSPGGILVTLLADIQRERDRSVFAGAMLDGRKASITDDGSSNGASTEDVGTHSLLSKDADEKEPLREDAVALAKHASASVATVLARRLTDLTPIPLDVGIDWLAVLRFFMRFPKNGSRHWEEELLDRMRKGGTGFKQPDVDALADQPSVPFLGPPYLQEVLEQRRSGKLRTELEAYYREFE
jgi:hypothetical protein